MTGEDDRGRAPPPLPSMQKAFHFDEDEDQVMSGNRDLGQSGRAAARSSGADLTPLRAIAESVTAEGGELVDQVSALIDRAQAFAAALVNATLTLRN